MSDKIKSTYGNIVVDDGSEKVEIENLHGEVIGVFYFVPTDMDIVKRYNQFVEKLDTILEPLEKVGVNADGSSEELTPEDFAILDEAKQRLYTELDYVFNGNMSEAFFGKRNPFAVVKGNFYCEVAIDILGTYISRAFGIEIRRINKSNNRTQQVPHGVRTGKHKNGGKKNNQKGKK